MATPHIGGIATLLLAAAPSLGAADYQIEDHDEGNSSYFDEPAKGLQFEDWETGTSRECMKLNLYWNLHHTTTYSEIRARRK